MRARMKATVSAMNAGAKWIWGATLPDDPEAGRRGWAELLIRVDSGFVPVIVVNHKSFDPGSGAVTSPVWSWVPSLDETRKVRSNARDTIRLAHLYRMLQTLGMAAATPAGGVIGLDPDRDGRP